MLSESCIWPTSPPSCLTFPWSALSFSTSLLSVSTNTLNGDRGASFSRAGREDENGRAPIRADDEDEDAGEGWNRGRGDDDDEDGRDDLADVARRWFTCRGRERRMVEGWRGR